jgi:hypothetical protein
MNNYLLLFLLLIILILPVVSNIETFRNDKYYTSSSIPDSVYKINGNIYNIPITENKNEQYCTFIQKKPVTKTYKMGIVDNNFKDKFIQNRENPLNDPPLLYETMDADKYKYANIDIDKKIYDEDIVLCRGIPNPCSVFYCNSDEETSKKNAINYLKTVVIPNHSIDAMNEVKKNSGYKQWFSYIERKYNNYIQNKVLLDKTNFYL